MIGGSEKCKRQLVFELQSLRVYEKRSKGHLHPGDTKFGPRKMFA